jgi:hypothetical protein
MSVRKPLGLLQYLALSEEELDFYKLVGRLPSETLAEQTAKNKPMERPKSKGGRPKLKFQINEKRAYYLWSIAKDLPESERVKITNRKLIEIAKTKPFRGFFQNTTSQSTVEQSISRGKKALKIDKHWNSKVCVLLEKEFHKLQS